MVSRQERADVFEGASNPQVDSDRDHQHARFDLQSIFASNDSNSASGGGKGYIDCEWGRLLEQNKHVLPTRDKGYIDCGWGRLLEENSKVGSVLGERIGGKLGTEDKGYIDCGWGRLLEANRDKVPNYYSQDNVVRGSGLLNRRPMESESY